MKWAMDHIILVRISVLPYKKKNIPETTTKVLFCIIIIKIRKRGTTLDSKWCFYCLCQSVTKESRVSQLLLSNMSRHPEIKWAQRVDKVYVTVQLPDSKNAKVDLTPDGVFTFSATAGAKDNLYELTLPLFDKVNVEESKINVGVRGIFCVVQKAESEWWKRLLKAEGKTPHYVKVDWDKWIDEDEDAGGDLDLGGMDFSQFGGGDDAVGDDFEDSDDEVQEVSKPEIQDGNDKVGEQVGAVENAPPSI
ncbi:HSP20 chaperones superfamily protein [Trifolium repens]|nr:HSP20 chaperones superfamily protein [Trifolium repens]